MNRRRRWASSRCDSRLRRNRSDRRDSSRPATLRQSLADLKRTCHPLDWEGRKAFVGLYLEKRGEEFTALRRLPFALYDIKQRLKQRWKRLRRRIAERVSTAGGFGAVVATEYGQLACEFAMMGAAMVGGV